MGTDREVKPLVHHRRVQSPSILPLVVCVAALACIGSAACSATTEGTIDGAARSLAGPSAAANNAEEGQQLRDEDNADGSTSPESTVEQMATDIDQLLVWSGSDDDRRLLLAQRDQILDEHRQAVIDAAADRTVSALTVERLDGSATELTLTSCAEFADSAVEIGQGHLAYQRYRVDFVSIDGRWRLNATTADNTTASTREPTSPAADIGNGAVGSHDSNDPDSSDPDARDGDVGCVTTDRAELLGQVTEGFLDGVADVQRHPADGAAALEDFAAAGLVESVAQSGQALMQAGVYYDDPQQHWVDVRGSNPLLDDGFVVRTCTFYPEGTNALVLGGESVATAETPFAAGTTLTRSWNVVSEPDPTTDDVRHLVAELRWQRLDHDCRPKEPANHSE